MNDATRKKGSKPAKNKAKRIIVTTLGIWLAIAGFEHGLYETLRGC